MGIPEVDHKHNEHAYSSTQNLENTAFSLSFSCLTFILQMEDQLLKQGLFSIFLNKRSFWQLPKRKFK